MSATDYSQDRPARTRPATRAPRRVARMRRATWPVRLVVGALLVAAFLVCGTAFRVWYVARADDRRPVDAVVVLGAAQYDGEPARSSPPGCGTPRRSTKTVWRRGSSPSAAAAPATPTPRPRPVAAT